MESSSLPSSTLLLQPYLSEIYKGGNLIFIITISPRQTTLPSPPRGSRPMILLQIPTRPPGAVSPQARPRRASAGNIQGVRGAWLRRIARFVQRRCLLLLRARAGENAPVSTYAMTAYTQALNYLLRSDNVRRIGDVTVVYWVENADPAIAAFAGAFRSAGAVRLGKTTF